MVEQHLSRLNAPKSWPIQRKGIKFITRPNPGSYTLEETIPLSLVLTNILKVARTRKEVKKILHEEKILVNNKVRKDYAFAVGLMDIVTIPSLGESYRILYTEKGKFRALLLDKKEADLLPHKIVNKHILAQKKVQLQFSCGSTRLVEKDSYKTGDSVVYSFAQKKIVSHYPLKKGTIVYVTGGKNKGKTGELQDIDALRIIVKTKDIVFETARRYAFPVGDLGMEEK